MPLKWSNLSKIQKILTGIAAAISAVVVIAGFMVAGYSHFMTDAEAAEQHETIIEDFESYQAQQLKSDKLKRVDQIQGQVDRIDYQLLEVELPQHKREYLTHKRGDLGAKVVCIQGDTC